MTRKKISVVTPCYQEEANVRQMADAVRGIMAGYSDYDYEHIFIDNGSLDRSASILRQLASEDERIKVILNARNFGQVRSGYYAILQSSGDAVIALACDFQDPPELIPRFITAWEQGARIVLGVKESASESSLFFGIRSRYYALLERIADVQVVKHATGFGLYDRSVVEALRRIDDPYPYFRGLLAEIGHTPVQISYHQPLRTRGITSQNFWTLYDMALLGIVQHSKAPLRLATILGFLTAIFSLLVGLGYLAYKLLFWDQFSVGVAPMLIGIFFISSVQLVFIGLVGEYLGAVWTHVRKHPHVFERERINFDHTQPRV